MLRRRFASLLPAVFLGRPVPAQYEEGKGDVPYVPTPENIVEIMLKLARVSRGDTLYDLGCGDGRIVIAAARQYGARGIGIDIDPERIKEARENAKAAGVTDRVEFREQDLFQTDLRPASVVTMYLLTAVNEKLKPKLLSELKPGTRVVSHQFNGMGDWKPKKRVKRGYRQVFYWVVPPRA